MFFLPIPTTFLKDYMDTAFSNYFGSKFKLENKTPSLTHFKN